MKIIEQYYNTMKNLRACYPYMSDVFAIEQAIEISSEQQQGLLASNLIAKYKTEMTKIGRLQSGRVIVAVDDVETEYSEMENDEYVEQLEYIRQCIIMISATRIGLATSLEDIVRKMNLEEKYGE